jgi:hypothetical protein
MPKQSKFLQSYIEHAEKSVKEGNRPLALSSFITKQTGNFGNGYTKALENSLKRIGWVKVPSTNYCTAYFRFDFTKDEFKTAILRMK